MQITNVLIASGLAITAVAAPAAAAEGTVEIVYTSYGNGDMTCADANAGDAVLGTPVGSCHQLPAGTSSIAYRVPAYATGTNGCTVSLYTNNACNGPAIEAFTVKNGDLQCKPPIGAGWESARLTCPDS